MEEGFLEKLMYCLIKRTVIPPHLLSMSSGKSA